MQQQLADIGIEAIIAYIEAPSGDIYFDALDIDHHLLNHFSQQHAYPSFTSHQVVSFTISGKLSIDCYKYKQLGDGIADHQDLFCYDVILIGKLANVTEQSETKMVHDVYQSNFVDNNYKLDLMCIYKMSISQIELIHAVTKQKVQVDVRDYYLSDEEDLIEFEGSYADDFEDDRFLVEEFDDDD